MQHQCRAAGDRICLIRALAVVDGACPTCGLGSREMSRQDANSAFAATSLLYGGNADYIDKLYARYEADPQAVDGQWRAFFESLKDDARDVVQNAEGPSWGRPDWPPLPRGDLVAALDGDWDEVGKAVAEKVQAKAQVRG